MTLIPNTKLRDITSFPELITYLADDLDWPIDANDFESYSFDWDAAEDLGVAPEHAAKIKQIKQLRPLVNGQPWGVFFIEFEPKKLPVGVLRRLLNKLVTKQRASANAPDRQTWDLNDLLFISSFGETRDEREIAFAHFHQEQGDLPTLRVLGWDGGDTPLKLDHVDKELHACLRWPDDENNPEIWRTHWSGAFKHRIGHTIQTADMLAKVLAELAKNIRDRCQTLIASEPDNGPLKKLYKAFQTALIHDLTEESFADTYAQTITYGLLTAAISRTDMQGGADGTFVQADNITDMVPVTNPFLKEMLQSFLHAGGRKGGLDFDELGVQDVVELLRGDETDLPSVLRDFGNKNPNEDPVIRFYEDFLTAYNKKLKIQRGVFYTPKPVVSYIVRSVHELLQTEFGLEDGLASTITWGEMIQRSASVSPASNDTIGQDARSPIKLPPLTDEPGEQRTIDPNEFFVQILDPATGTGTFIVEVIDVIYKHLSNKWKTGGANAMPPLKECGHPARIEEQDGHPACNEVQSGQDARAPFLDPYSEIAIHEHHLPHWQQGEVFYFVTWRLADSLSADKLAIWQQEKDIWLRHHPKPWDAKTEAEYHQQFSRRIDEWLDAGHGSCLLREQAVAQIVANAFHHFDNQRYELDSFVVMPNHVHVLFRLRAGEALQKVIHSWKSFTAKEINKATERTGVLWQEDYWDRIIRNERHLAAVRNYIERNRSAGVPSALYYQRSEGVPPLLRHEWSVSVSPVSERGNGQDARAPFSSFDAYWNAYVPKCLLPRLYAYELMMAPYAIAHMKIGLKLHETGYRFKSNERVRVYLTNALEPWQRQLLLPDVEALAHEAAAVNEVKKTKRFTVVIGNPPYNNSSENKTPWIMGLIETYKETVRREETQIQALSDDYIKFLRLADWSIGVSGIGTIGMITNNGFLDGHIFRDLRQYFAATFNSVRVVNLHGDSRKKETAPDGSADKNVFDIMQGVSLTIVARTDKYIRVTPIFYQDVWGDRHAKYQFLLAGLPNDVWLPIERSAATKMFVPIRGFSALWDRACQVAECFGTGNWVVDKTYAYGSGFKSQQDELAITFEKESLIENIETLLQPDITEAELRKRFSLCNTNQWSFGRARERLRKRDWRKAIQKVLFRPFDFRYTLITADIVTNPRREIMAQLERPNIALLATRKATEGFSIFATGVPCGHKIVGNYDMTTVFPVYRYPIKGESELAFGNESREVNFAPAFLRKLADELNLAQTKPHNLPVGLTPEDIFHYAYAVFHSPGYRSRYAEFLKIDFPRLPLTSSLDLFRSLARLGGELVALHLLEFNGGQASSLSAPVEPTYPQLTEYIGENRTVSKVGWTDDTVWIDAGGKKGANTLGTSGFRGVPSEVWNFHIGGYQVCEKWLKDRKGRTLTDDDNAHYHKIVVALANTIRLMNEIDAVIETHGGWPGAFATAEG